MSNIDRVRVPRLKCNSCGKTSGPTLLCSEFRKENGPIGFEKLSDIDSLAIAARIKKADETILQFKTEIDDLEKVTARLRLGLQKVEGFAERERSRLSPVRRLSDDVLGHLFAVCQRELDSGIVRADKPDSIIRTVTQVSSHWRKVAHSFPELWAHVRIENVDKPLKAMLSTIEECITRSKKRPLTVQFGTLDRHNWPTASRDQTTSRELMVIIAKHSHRFKEVTLNLDCLLQVMKDFIPSYVQIPFTRLESLNISLNCQPDISLCKLPALSRLSIYGYGRVKHEDTLSFTSVPLLTQLELVGLPLSGGQNVLKGIPWSQIEKLTTRGFTCFDDEDFFNILTGMPNLNSLSIDGGSGVKRLVTLPSLRTLYVSGNRDMLDFVVAPGLVTLEIGLYGTGTAPDIASLLRRTNGSVTNLTLCGRTFTAGLPPNAVENLPYLKNLTFISGTNLQWLMGLHHSVFPELETLQLLEINPKHAEVLVCGLVALLMSRLQHRDIEGGDDPRSGNIKSVTIGFALSSKGKRLVDGLKMDALKTIVSSDFIRQSGTKIIFLP